MRFTNDNNYEKVDLKTGLARLVNNSNARLYSNGLEENEYIYFNPKSHAICYEDRCVIGHDDEHAYKRLAPLKWIEDAEFYLYEPETTVWEQYKPVIEQTDTAVLEMNWLSEQTQNQYIRPVLAEYGTVEFPAKTLPKGCDLYFNSQGHAMLRITHPINNNTLPDDLKYWIAWSQKQNIHQFIIR